MDNSHNFLVTGCAGFIGGHMVELLLSKGYAVVGIDDLSTGKRENMNDFRDKITFFEGSLCDPQLVARALAGITHIIHLASIPSVPRSISDPLENMHSSVTSSVTLFSQAAKTGSVKRIVQASSSAVYGNGETLPSREDLLPDALSPYAAAKLSQEYYAKAFRSSLDVVSLRYFNVFGPRQDPASEYAAVIPKFITLLLEGKQPVIFGDGEQTRDFIYVEDVVAANLAAALYEKRLAGEVFNVATGTSINLIDLVDCINKILGTSIQPKHSPERQGEVKHSQADITKIKQGINLAPALGFHEGLRRTVAYFMKK